MLTGIDFLLFLGIDFLLFSLTDKTTTVFSKIALSLSKFKNVAPKCGWKKFFQMTRKEMLRFFFVVVVITAIVLSDHSLAVSVSC